MRILSRLVFAGPALALGLFCSRVAAQPRYALFDLGNTSNTVSIEPFDTIPINAAGTIALWNVAADRQNLRAVRWENGTLTELGTLSGDPAAKAWGLNNAGQIVGSSGSMTPSGSSFSFTRRRGFLHNGTALQEFSTSATAAYGINDAGAIVGEGTGGPFLFSAGVYRQLTAGTGFIGGRAKAINAQGRVVGTVNLTTSVRHAFLYDGGVMRDLGTLGGNNSTAEAINADGVVVGWANTSDGATRAYRYANGTMNELPAPGGSTDVRAYAVNRAGHILGFYRATPATFRAFLYADDVVTTLSEVAPLRTGTNPGFTELVYGCGINDAGYITGIGSYSTGGPGSAELHAFLLVPAGTASPANPLVAAGSTAVLTATPNVAVTSYQWQRNGVAIPGATQASLVLFDTTAAQSGIYACRFNTANGEYLSSDSALTVTTDPGELPSRLSNLSVLTSLSGANDGFTVATVVGGGAAGQTKPLLVRAVGPSLATLNVPNVLADPRLEFFAGATKQEENDNWGGAAAIAAASAQVGAFALQANTSRDAALFLETSPGDRSVRISGTGAGAVIAEIYDATPTASVTATTPRLTNLSVLKPIGTSLTAGFVIAGTNARTVLIRAVGPTLAQVFSIPNTVADPKVALFSGQTKIAENDNWGTGPAGTRINEIGTRVGAFALASGSRDGALVVTLAPGNYTVEVTGVAGATGTALVEVYEVR